MGLNLLALGTLMFLAKGKDPDGAYTAVIPKWTSQC